MKICVCGWYFNPGFMKQLESVRDKVVVVSHKNVPINFAHVYRPNVGLEWGAYNHYLMKLYNGKGKVLFIHDDNEVEDGFFEEVEKCNLDVGYVFRNAKEAEWAFNAHGRAIVMSERFLNHTRETKYNLVLQDTKEKYKQHGFWHDKDNHGFILETREVDPNKGIRRFQTYLKFLREKNDMKFGVIYSDKIKFGFRGDNGLSEIRSSINSLKPMDIKWADARQGIF